MTERTPIDQLWHNYRKAFIARIRLKHAILADNEINEKLPRAKQEFDRLVQKGVRPAPEDLTKALGA